MAAIDKIYGTYDNWLEFHSWVANSKRPQYCKYFYPTPMSANGYSKDHVGPLTNFPTHADKWLYKNCPIKWVKKRIREQYNGAPK